jgi:hypothetical protein
LGLFKDGEIYVGERYIAKDGNLKGRGTVYNTDGTNEKFDK